MKSSEIIFGKPKEKKPHEDQVQRLNKILEEQRKMKELRKNKKVG